MARIRYLKPGFFDHEGLASVSAHARLAFAGLWLQADREGRLKDEPGRLRVRIFPYEPKVNMDAILTSLAEIGVIVRYQVADEGFLSIPGFLEHQRPHPKEPASDLPPCNAVKKHGRKFPVRTLIGTLTGTLTGTENRNGEREQEKDSAFGVFWDAYPRKVKKADAEKAWKAVTPSADTLLDAMLSALRWQVTQPGWLKDGGKFIPYPASWLRAAQWTDEPFQLPSTPAPIDANRYVNERQARLDAEAEALSVKERGDR